MRNYQQFYQSQIERARHTSATIAGLITINGPTGLGKTSAITQPSPEGDHSVLRYLVDAKLQGIFVTHRWNILQQTAKEALAQGLAVSVVYSRQEQVSAAVQGRPFKHESPDLPPGDWREHLASLSEAGLWVNSLCSLSQLQQLCMNIARQDEQLTKVSTWSDADDLQQQCRQVLNFACKQLETAVLQNLQQLEQQVKGTSKPKGKRRRQLGVNQLTQSPWERYRAHPWVRRILPALAWHDEQQPLLIMTTHKFFHGFFDGKQRARMADAHTQGHVVFIDEFEYQEPVLLSLLSQAQHIQELPQCLGVLMDEGKRALPRIRAANKEDELLNRLLDDLEQLFINTQTRLNTVGIDFPEQRALITDDNSNFISRYLFQSDYTISERPTYLIPALGGLQVADRPGERRITAGYFFAELELLLRKTLRVMARLPISAQLGSGKSVRDELMHLIFNAVNDYKSGHYHQHINMTMLMAGAPHIHLPELAELANSNTLPHTQAHVHGFSCWLFTPAQEQTDSLRIAQQRAHIPTTPEALLVALASRNLVFGLSATAMVQRTLGHFDMKWVTWALQRLTHVRRHSQVDASVPLLPLPIMATAESDEAQQAIIAALSMSKARLRNNQLTTQVQDFTESSSVSGAAIAEALAQLPAEFFQDDNTAVSEIAKEYRRDSLQAMLNIVFIAGVSSAEHQGHLAYANSLRFFRKWLGCVSAAASRERLASYFSQSPPEPCAVAVIESLAGSPWFTYVWLARQPLLLCWLTADSQKDPQFATEYAKAFASGIKVLVFTQVASATNGINLNIDMPDRKTMPDSNARTQNVNGKLRNQDLSCIYLYEGRHFYFSTSFSPSGEPEMTGIGAQIRQLQKLRQGAFVSQLDYQKGIASLMQGQARKVNYLNYELYKNTTDYQANAAADVQQQIGRIERVWDLMAHTQVHIQTELADCLMGYANSPHGYAQHKSLMSPLNQGVFDTLQARANEPEVLTLLLAPKQSGAQIEQIIDRHLVPQIIASRKPHYGGDVYALQQLWETLGRAALRRDLACGFNGQELGLAAQRVTLKDWACITLPPEADPEAGVWWRFQDERFLAAPTPGAQLYRLAPLYRWVNHHHAISQWFKRHGYACSGDINNGLEQQYLFHPAFTQRILQGRIGEESVRALLESEGIHTNTQLLSPHTLEVADFHLTGTPLYIDAKFWGVNSLARADANFQQTLRQSGSGWGESLKEKLAQLRRYDPQARLVIANVVGSESEVRLKGGDISLAPANVATAPILVLAGCLDPEQENVTTAGFSGLCELAHYYLAQA